MQVWHGIQARPKSQRPSVVTLGNFDGVHYGHRELLKRLLSDAGRLQATSIAMTFDPHPIQILHPERELKRLFPRDDLIEQLTQLKVDELILQPFSREFSQLQPSEFFNNFLMPLGLKLLVVGHDFSFGVDRSGNLDLLKELCDKASVQLDIVEPLKMQNRVLSSSAIRQALASGRPADASTWLGRAFYLKGIVEKGDQRGHTIGFPTANIQPQNEFMPKTGVYVTKVHVGPSSHWAVTNIGVNPTFKDKIAIRVETHVLNFNEDLYGRAIKVEFYEYIREEKKFNGVDQLVAQIKLDIIGAEKWIKERG